MANPIEQIGVKAVGTAKAVKAGFNGLRGVFLHLAEEHGEVAALMKPVSKSSDAEFRREHYPRIRAELLSHERAELTVVYAMLSNYLDTRDVAAAHNVEAQQLEQAIAELDALDYATPAWGPAFERVYAMVQQHVAEEENSFFPKAQTLLGEAETNAMLDRYEAAKKVVKETLKPL